MPRGLGALIMCMNTIMLFKDKDRMWVHMLFSLTQNCQLVKCPYCKTICDSKTYLTQDKSWAVIWKWEIKENGLIMSNMCHLKNPNVVICAMACWRLPKMVGLTGPHSLWSHREINCVWLSMRLCMRSPPYHKYTDVLYLIKMNLRWN